MSSSFETILILDFGSQYTQLIGRRIREANVYSEIVPFNTPLEKILSHQPERASSCPAGRIRSTKRVRRLCDPAIFDLDIPVLGVCYGMQLMAKELGGKVEPVDPSRIRLPRDRIESPSCLLDGMRRVWMSHGDRII